MFTLLPSVPHAIIHVDGDAFFVACELASQPWLKGKPVVTGKERGIASALSYEAKARGLSRGMPVHMMRNICPDLIVLPSDYDTYALYSQRMYTIVRKYTPLVDEYGIDECFADITGCDERFHLSYENLARTIQKELSDSLGITFSIGLSVNKVLAKIGSKWEKPSGFTHIPIDVIGKYLEQVPVGKVWGIGGSTALALNRCGIKMASEFAAKSPAWVADHFSKPMQEIHAELCGQFVMPLSVGPKDTYKSISKTRTFTPASRDRSFIFAQLSKNIENACSKLRRHALFTKRFSFFLKTQEFSYQRLEVILSHRTSVPRDILQAVRERFDLVYRPDILYRASGVTLMDIEEESPTTSDLFGDSKRLGNMESLFRTVDQFLLKYGSGTIFLASSMRAKKDREADKKKMGLPFLGIVR